MTIKAAPGILIIEPLQEDKSSLVLQSSNPTRLLKGKVIDIGEALVTDFGATIGFSVEIGRIVYFLSYEGDYDNIKVNGKKLYMVKLQDLRGYEN